MKNVITLTFVTLIVVNCSSVVNVLPNCESRFSASKFLQEANELRIQSEVEPLILDSNLSIVSQKWAEYNSNKGEIVHYDEQGKGPLNRLKNAGINKKLVAQNIANVPLLTPLSMVFDSWKSKKEEENLVNPFYREIGYGVASFKNGCVLVILLSE
ncbi:MAG: CAP domain-containing protein [Leptonema sp. (in: Bacteria)]|nr:CAP domain-containing protein [Leptonema sp. (in: bacteria)]